jgi:putative transferase (TIGR04331 family)
MRPIKKLLVTTALDSTWGSHQNIVFLGEWCKKYSMKDSWESRQYQTLDYHWKDREKLSKDHIYLESLNEDMLIAMTSFLNNFHGIEKSSHYWRIIIGPWLLAYISVLWDRWEAVSLAIRSDGELETFIINKALIRPIPKDFTGFREVLDSDGWNHGIFASILKERAFSKITFLSLDTSLPIESTLPTLSLTFRQKFLPALARFADSCIQKFSSKTKKILFFHSYFPKKHLLYFYFKLRLFPLWHSVLKQKIHYPDASNREDLKFHGLKDKNDFESYLCKSIASDIPVAYLEGYQDLFILSKTLTNARVIFTANAYIGNELFKVWSAGQVISGSKLIISSHGGAFVERYDMFNHEDKIANSRVVWGRKWLDSQISMPANKIHFKIKNYHRQKKILFIDFEATRYGYRCSSAPIGPLVLKVFENNMHFLRSLDQKLICNLKIRPKSLGSWETKLRYIDGFGVNSISKESTILKDMQNSKVIICSYPQTTFAEAMYSGIPTILLLTKNYWEFQLIYDDLLEELHRVKILHFNPLDAAKHLAEIYPNPEIWWESSDVVSARKKFNEICLTITENPLNRWTTFLKNIDTK